MEWNVRFLLLFLFYNRRSDSSQWWIHRGDFKVSDQLLNEEEYDLSPHLEEELEEKKSFRFTEYSMTSSVVPRSEGIVALTTLSLLIINPST